MDSLTSKKNTSIDAYHIPGTNLYGDKAREYEKMMQMIADGTMSLSYDRAFTFAMSQNLALPQHMLDCVLGKGVVRVDSVSTEKELRYKVGGRAMRLDFFGTDLSRRKIVNIEMQMNNIDDVPYKMRLNQSYIDRTRHRIGSQLDEISDLYVLFFVDADIFGANQPMYEPPLDYWWKGGKPFDDGVRRIIVNMRYQGDEDTELNHLIQDLKQTDIRKMHSNIMKDALQLVLEGGNDMWVKVFDGSPYEAYMAFGDKKYKKGKAEGKAEVISEMVNRLHYVKGLSASQIAELTGCSLDQVEAALSKRG